MAHISGATSASCYGHEVEHENSIRKDCGLNCPYKLQIIGEIDNVLMEIGNSDVSILKCDSIYESKSPCCSILY